MKKLLFAAFALFLASTLPARAVDCTLTTVVVGPPKIVACTDTTATTLTIPADWDTTTNKLEAIGPGGNGRTPASNTAGAGGSGGCYAIASNITSSQIQAGDVLNIVVPAGGGAASTLLKARDGTTIILAADFGRNATGTLNPGVCSITSNVPASSGFAGGNGGLGKNSASTGAGGGGGSAGPTGAGKNGGDRDTGGIGAGGGGGSNGGSSTAGTTGSAGVSGGGGNGTGGTGGGGGATGSAGPTAASAGGGGGGGRADNGANPHGGGNGAVDTAWGTGFGAGGGGGGGGGATTGTVGAGGNGGTYGAGGGGGGNVTNTFGAGGTGGTGIIVLTYTPVGGAAGPFFMLMGVGP